MIFQARPGRTDAERELLFCYCHHWSHQVFARMEGLAERMERVKQSFRDLNEAIERCQEVDASVPALAGDAQGMEMPRRPL